MASKLYNRARVTITSTGTGTLSLGSPVSGYQSFASAGAQNNDVVSYVIEDGLNWEVGTGTFSSAANTLTRTVTQSSSGATAISVTTAAQVFISPLAADLLLTGLGGTLAVSSGGTGATTLTGVVKGNGTSAFTAATAGTDYLAPPSGTSILKANSGGALANATAGTDYLAPPSGTSILKANSGGALANATAGTDYVAPGGALGTPTSGNFSTGTFTWPTFNQNTSGTSANVTGVVAAANGGTGQSSYTVGDILYASGSTAISKLAGVATGNALISGGTSTAPSWGKIGISTHVSGLGTNVATALGNTTNSASGICTLDSNGYLLVNTTSAQALLTVVGTGTTSGTNAVSVFNSGLALTLFTLRNDGWAFLPSTYNNTTASAATLYIHTDGSLRRSTASSVRHKENIETWSGNGLGIIQALRPTTFNYKPDYYSNPERKFLGLIAEEVAIVSNYLVDYSNEDGTGDIENVRYANIVVPLIKAVQELSDRVSALEAKQ